MLAVGGAKPKFAFISACSSKKVAEAFVEAGYRDDGLGSSVKHCSCVRRVPHVIAVETKILDSTARWLWVETVANPNPIPNRNPIPGHECFA